MTVGRVVEIWRYPVKSMQDEPLPDFSGFPPELAVELA
jgi:uncharacterized protein YcbX